ncbi:hypothetical protein ACOSP6_01855 [Tenacibaculum sp. MEBiC06402]|uniref:hypothetical protein n=1 Tax=unclassified Tenacibaculum TaxID=2635139 RepID=UPI003B9C5AF6
MGNTLLFNQFDIIASFTENTINNELLGLVNDGTIEKELIVYRTVDSSGNYNYSVVQSASDIPDGAEYINGEVTPSIKIEQSGSAVTLLLNFDSGVGYFVDKAGFGPIAKLKKYDMTGWKYGININLELTRFNDKLKASSNINQQLNDLQASNLSINSLFLNFVSSDLETSNPAFTDCPKEMVEFMSFYFKHLDATQNPYILGYNISSDTSTNFSDKLPAQLKPTGTDFTVYADTSNEGLSNLNYTMVTQGGHQRIVSSPSVLTSNWFANASTAGKMIISHQCLLEDLILIPFYNNLSQTIYSQVSRHVSVGHGNSYNAAKSISGNTWSFNIANYGSGDNQYVNSFTVTIQNNNGFTNLAFNGSLRVYKEVSKSALFCTARAHASASVSWSGNVKIAIDGNGLSLTNGFKITHQSSGSSKNSCAKAFSWIGKILGGILDVFTGWTDGGFFSNLLSEAFSVNIPGIGTISLALGNFSNAISSFVLTPTGKKYKVTPSSNSPSFDNEGNLYLDLN